MYLGRLVAIFAGLFIFIVILVLLFTGGGKKPAVTGVVLRPLPEYAETNATVSFTTQGIVNADELHRSIRISVSANQTNLDVLQGYNPRVISSKTFVNNQEAYTVFLKSIEKVGFLAKIKNPKVTADPAGYCPLGFRYVYNLSNDGDDLSNLWTSTCGKAVGNSNAATSTLNVLFQNQVPNYSTLINQVNLNSTTTE
jgi:hypothetical protein